MSTSKFPCTRVFHFVGAPSSSCQWSVDSKSVLIYPPTSTSSSSIVPTLLNTGDSITILSNVLRASCMLPSLGSMVGTKAASCGSWPTLQRSNLTIMSPVQRAVPVVSISAPESIGACDSLTLGSKIVTLLNIACLSNMYWN